MILKRRKIILNNIFSSKLLEKCIEILYNTLVKKISIEREINMEIKITGKDLKATEAIKDYVEKKLTRLEKYFDGNINVVVTIRTEGKEQIAEMAVKAKGDNYRTEVASNDLYASIDKNIDILEGQIRKYKTKRERMTNESIRTAEIEQPVVIENEIIKTIYYEIKPMTAEDAKLKLQEKPVNQFYTFINLDTNKVNVIYRLKDGKNYGIVEPEA